MACRRHIILGCNIPLLLHVLFSLLLTSSDGRKGLDRERKKRKQWMVLGAEERPGGTGKRRNSCGAGREMETGNETDTLPLWEGGLSQCEQKTAKMKGRKPEKRRKMEQGRSQRTTGSSAKRTEMKAGTCWEKQTVKKPSGTLCKRQGELEKSPMKMPAAHLLKLQYTYVNITPQISTRGGGLGLIFNCTERISAMQNMNFSSH